jgi:hypothetical protein
VLIVFANVRELIMGEVTQELTLALGQPMLRPWPHSCMSLPFDCFRGFAKGNFHLSTNSNPRCATYPARMLAWLYKYVNLS